MGGDYRRGDDRDRGRRDDFDFRKPEYRDDRDDRGGRDRYREDQPQQGGGGDDCNSQVIGWVVFILIFGVGNLILYQTTGMLIIPIRR
ncbi:MAG: hypothetical protein K2W96_20195 [Gemmataceae bacterium]|nr:hypothetical protein [Gemmataceae bacterium]